MNKIQSELRLLKAYAVLSAILFTTLLVLAAKGSSKKVKFVPNGSTSSNPTERSASLWRTASECLGGRRLESISRLDMGIASCRRMVLQPPDSYFSTMMATKCGGLVYGSKIVDGKPTAVVRLSFDHYRQNEAIDIAYGEEGGYSRSGLEVVDTGGPITADGARKVNAILMKDGPEKDAAMKKFGSEHAARWAYVGCALGGHSRDAPRPVTGSFDCVRVLWPHTAQFLVSRLNRTFRLGGKQSAVTPFLVRLH